MDDSKLDDSNLAETEKEFFNNNSWKLINFISFLEKRQEVDKRIHHQWKCALYRIITGASANKSKSRAKIL